MDKHNLKIGYDYEMWYDYQIKLPIIIDLKSHIHFLITGSSGSGKSQSLKYYIYGLACLGYDIWIADFKNSGDFGFMKENYYVGTECIECIDKYYELFLDIKERRIVKNERTICIIDEYPALISYLSGISKKQADAVKQKISEIIMMGRSIGSNCTATGLWIIAQRPDSGIFVNTSSRDQFMVSITFGRMSQQMKTMLYAGEDIPNRTYQKGEGIVLADGMSLREIKVPLITNQDKMELEIIKNLQLLSKTK